MHQGFAKENRRWPKGAATATRGGPPPRYLARCGMGLLAVGCLIFGTGCPSVIEQYTVTSIPQLSESPSLAEVAQLVNQNSTHVASLYSSDVRIKASRLPTVSAKLAYAAPRRFRLVAETALTGVEVDMGSNDELFWFWAKRNEPPTMFFCRHDRYHTSAASQMMPIDPQWVIESMGLTTLDLQQRHNGPHALGNGRYAVETLLHKSNGIWKRTIVVDSAVGAVVEQHLRDPFDRLVTSAIASQHDHDPLNEVTLPGNVILSWPAAEFTLEIAVKDWEINYPDQRPVELWQMPQSVTDRVIDLADPRAMQQAAAAGR